MASALADPILLFFLAGLLASGFLLANGRGKKGLEGTSRMLDGSLAFATTGLLGSARALAIHSLSCRRFNNAALMSSPGRSA